MGTSTIDGTIEAAELKRTAKGLSLFNSIRFRLDDGSTRTITKAVANTAIADELVPGSTGCFYLFTGFDLKGVHGIRRSDGTAICDFPSRNAKLFLLVGVINLAWIVLRVGLDGTVPLLGVALLVLAGVGYTLLSKTAREAQAQFDADNGAPGAAPETAAEAGA